MIRARNQSKPGVGFITVIFLALGAFGFSFLYLGCAKKEEPGKPAAEPRPSPTAPAKAPEPKEKAESPKTAAVVKAAEVVYRKYLLQGENEEGGYGLYSYLIFSGEPANDTEFKRYLTLYRAYRDKIRKYPEPGFEKISKAEVNITYWPLRVAPGTKIPAEEWAENERFFVENYDYSRVSLTFKVPKQDLKHVGPFILAYHFPLGNVPPDPAKKEMLLIDLSGMDEELFGEMLGSFQEKVTALPKSWKEKFDWEFMRTQIYASLKPLPDPILFVAEWEGKQSFEVKKPLERP